MQGVENAVCGDERVVEGQRRGGGGAWERANRYVEPSFY